MEQSSDSKMSFSLSKSQLRAADATKAFHVFSLEKWNNQFRLIKGCYSGQESMVSELLKAGAPDEINPLFTLKTVGIPHHPRVSSWPPRALLEARA